MEGLEDKVKQNFPRSKPQRMKNKREKIRENLTDHELERSDLTSVILDPERKRRMVTTIRIAR